MYMPLCRDCHSRESRLNGNHFEGNPELVNVKAENEAQKKKDNVSPKEFDLDTQIDVNERDVQAQLNAKEESGVAQKSFSTDYEGSSLDDTPE